MSDPLWTRALAITNAVLFGSLAALEIKMGKKDNPRWLRLMRISIGLYWSALYTFVALTPAGYVNPVWFGQIFVRPAFTMTGAIMLAAGIYRYRTSK